jgi:hypothetical protein
MKEDNRSWIQKLFFPWNTPTSATEDGWNTFTQTNQTKYPIRWWLIETTSSVASTVKRWGHSTLWEFKWRLIPKHQYNVIRTSLKPGYYDPDIRILHAVMDEIKRFVDRTKDTIVWDSDDHHIHVWNELQAIYTWWIETYPNRENSLPDFPNVESSWLFGSKRDEYRNHPDVIEWRRIGELHNKMEREWEREEEEMLIRAIKIRKNLWYP